ncbi:peptidylprolyl isomerase [Nannocystis bainbridge]|uniref:peptidylprolyl isomerase n=1 Tax=Nannocystis bainbridge TaxID=2995303 RepID=A0ABT5EBM8_9BACT|nr:peptidylprolyl isomerase [Nannocystis bainbridge]MDC0723269.1 peptidylprolyl isomerase [Nannocystis bainbridge]
MRTPPRSGPGIALAALCACASGPRPFPPPVPEVLAHNQTAGDPHAGRFTYDEAVAGLPEGTRLLAILATDAGEIRCTLEPGEAPIAVANFVGLARGLRPFQDAPDGPWHTAPYYDGTLVHRVQDGEFIQAGRRGSGPGFVLQDEMSAGHVFDRPGLLALANSGRPHTSAAEFFISIVPLTQLKGKHTIIGACDSEDVVRELARRALADATNPPKIETVTIRRDP